MNWTRPADIKTRVNKWWDSGELLAEIVTGTSSFPRTITVKQPSAKEMSDCFHEVRSWAAQFHKVSNCSIEWHEVNHRILGRNKLPTCITIATADDAYAIIGKQRESKKFQHIIEITRAREPDLLAWLIRRPHRALELYEQWEQLVAIVSWIRDHPRPNIYLRQVDIPGIHTKLLEEHRVVLSELLDLVLPPEQIENSATGKNQFARRYGFLEKPLRIRFRILDPVYALLPDLEGKQDITMDGESFSALRAPVTNVFFTENEVNYLAFPLIRDSMVIFGSGYGFDVLANVSWLFQCRVYYWGDIDTHGFNILNSARKHLPHIRSILMDEETLLSHRSLWASEGAQFAGINLSHLTESEHEIYTKLKNQFWGLNVRLEQEMIAWHRVESAISRTISTTGQYSIRPFEDAKSFQNNFEPVILSYADIFDLLKPSKCELRVFLKNNGTFDREESPYERVIRESTKQFKLKHKAGFSDVRDLGEMDSSIRVLESKIAIQNKSNVIHKPLLVVQTFLDGTNIEIRGEPDFLIREAESYFLRNVKFARRIVQSQHPEIFLEAQLHGWLFAQITGHPPSRLEVLSGDGRIHNIQYDGGCSILKHLAEIMIIRGQPEEPYSPVGLAKCQGCNFHSYCRNRAERTQDVSILPGVDQELSRILRRLGGGSIEPMVKEFDAERLSKLQRRVGGKLQRVGDKATNILLSARALTERTHIMFQQPMLPDGANFAVVDFEGLPPQFDDGDFVYLWGMQVFGERPSKYLAALADDGIKSDAKTWFEFLDNANQIFLEYGDIPFIHWHHYERTKLDRYIETYGDPLEFGKRVKTNLVDLLPIVQSSIALPVSSYSLKVVEKYAGFQRSQDQFGGEWAIAKYIESLHSENHADRQSLAELLRYNSEDLQATWAVFKWIDSIKRTVS